MAVVLCTDAMTASRWFFTRLSARVSTAPSLSRPPLPRPPDPSGGCLPSSWRQWYRRGIQCKCHIPAARTHPDVHWAHPWSRRHRRAAPQSFPPHHLLRCCRHSLCSAGSGDVWRVVWHGFPPDLPHSGPPSGPHWNTPLFVPERPVPCTLCCHPRGVLLGTLSTGPVDSRNMPLFCPPLSR
jgi:hypothetical protein